MVFTLKTAPTSKAVKLDLVKDHLKVTGTSENSYINLLIDSAQNFAEKYQERKFITQTWTAKFERFQNEFLLPFPPLQSVSSVSYYNDSDVLTTVATSVYEVDTGSEHELGKVVLADGQSWPTDVDEREKPVEIEFIVGYGNTHTSVPAETKNWMLLQIGSMYENRQTEIVGTIVGRFNAGIHLLDYNKVYQSVYA